MLIFLEFFYIQNLVGQAYDGVSAMSGSERGVQNLLRKEISTIEVGIFVPHEHCPPHQLNSIFCLRTQWKRMHLLEYYFF